MPSISGLTTTEGITARGPSPGEPALQACHWRCRRRARPRREREEIRGRRRFFLFFLFLLFTAEDDEEEAGAMPIHRLQASFSSWVSGRSSRTFALIRCILLSSSLLLRQRLGHKERERERAAASHPPSGPPRLVEPPTAPEQPRTRPWLPPTAAQVPQGYPAALQLHWPSSGSLERRAEQPPPSAQSGGGLQPVPSRSIAAHAVAWRSSPPPPGGKSRLWWWW